MADDPLTQDLHTSILIFAPLCLLSLFTGGVLEFSSWFGFPLAYWLHLTGSWAHLRIGEARNVRVKVVEVVIVGIFHLMITSLSILSALYFPAATKAFALSAISLTPPLIALIYRLSSRKFNHHVLLASASVVIITSVAVSGFTKTTSEIKDQSTGHFDVSFPVALFTATGVAALYRVILVLREKVSVPAIRWISLLILAICGGTALIRYLDSSKLSAELTTATAAAGLFFLFLDVLSIQIRSSGMRLTDWNDQNVRQSLFKVAVKFTALLTVAFWGGLVPYGMPCIDPACTLPDPQAERHRKDNESFFGTFYIVSLMFAFVLHAAMRVKAREQEPLVADVDQVDKKTAIRISGIAVALIMMLAIATYYCLAPRPLLVPEPFLLVLVASLFIVLTHLLDSIRGFIAPNNRDLRVVFVGLSIYLFVYFIYTTVTTGNRYRRAMVNSTNVTLSAEEIEATKGEQRFKDMAVLAFFYSAMLAVHFSFAIWEDDTKWRRKHYEKAAAKRAAAKTEKTKGEESASLLDQEDESDENDDVDDTPLI